MAKWEAKLPIEASTQGLAGRRDYGERAAAEEALAKLNAENVDPGYLWVLGPDNPIRLRGEECWAIYHRRVKAAEQVEGTRGQEKEG